MATSSEPRKQAVSVTDDVCRFFSAPGGCKRGETCIYKHDQQPRKVKATEKFLAKSEVSDHCLKSLLPFQGDKPTSDRTTSLFGKNPGGTFKISQSNLFGAETKKSITKSSPPSVFGGDDKKVLDAAVEPSTLEQKNVFGKTNVAATSSGFGTAPDKSIFEPKNVFGKPTIAAPAASFGAVTSGTSLGGAENLFGKASTFGDGGTAVSVAGSDVFRKPDFEAAASLFGKPSSPPKSSSGPVKGLFGKGSPTHSNLFSKGQTVPQFYDMERRKSDGATEDLSETESEVSEGGRPRMERTVSRDELREIKSIICEQVPDLVNNVKVLKKHFSKFGDVTRVFPNTNKKTAIVHFLDHKSAKAAKARGKTVHPKIPPIGNIFYTQSSPGSKSRKRSTSTAPPPADVDDELAAMQGTADSSFGGGAGQIATKPVAKLFAAKPPTMRARPVFAIKSRLGGSRSEPLKKVRPEKAVEPIVVTPPPENQKKIAGVSELLVIMKSQALDNGDRFRILEARDKYIRLITPRSVTRSGLDLEHNNLKGSCPDFCPEKERYSRADKNQLMWYEKLDGEFHQKICVKEHSRSAADQEMALLHELRPPAVLSRTLDFMMINIVDRVDNMVGTMAEWFQFIEKLRMEQIQPLDPMSQFYVLDQQESNESSGDWFQFIWDKTRAIRKDITQQNMTDLVSASLVEKCSRFHIFCAERLCEEDPNDFAPRLNDENLTKGLTSLKQMYYDLSLDLVICPCESEFRAYDILLNINQGDTLRSVQNLSENIRSSPEVRFALKVFSALNNNNYCKFFKLVREANYLQACLIFRYFNQVRRKALETIVKSYCPSSKQVIQYPLGKLVTLLGFENAKECCRFCRTHGIESEEDSDTVYLDRSTFMYPDTAPPPTRAQNLIESKRLTCYGDVMNGGPLPPNPYLDYEPHDSFTEEGYLKEEAYQAKDQKADHVSPEELEKRREAEEKKNVIVEVSKGIYEEIVAEICCEECDDLARLAVYDVQSEAAAETVVEEIVEDVTEEMVESVVGSVLREARNRLLTKALEDEQRLADETEASQQIVLRWVDEISREVSSTAIKEMEREKRLEKYLSMASAVVDGLIHEYVKENAGAILEEAKHEIVIERDARVRLFSQAMKKKRMGKIFREWRRLAVRSRKQREVVTDFPCSGAGLNVEEQNRRLGWGGARGVYKGRSISLINEQKLELDRMVRAIDLSDSMVQNAILEPFNLVEMVGEELPKKHKSLAVGWKLLVSFPEMARDSQAVPIMEMIKRKFRKSGSRVNDDEDVLVCQTSPFEKVAVSMCVRLVSQHSLEAATFSETARKKVFAGTSGIMFVYFDTEETLDQATERLGRIIINRPKFPAVPLCVLSSLPSNQVVEMLDLNDYQKNGFISCFNVYEISLDIFNIDNVVTITASVGDIIRETPHLPLTNLTKKYFRDYIEDFLSPKVFSEFYHNLSGRRRRGLPDQMPEALLSLYHAGLDHLTNTARDIQLQEISWPIPEFGPLGLNADVPVEWNDAPYVDGMLQVIQQLRLEPLEVVECDSWNLLVEQVWRYVDRIAVPELDCSILESTLRRSLAKCYRSFVDKCCSRWGGEESVPPPEMLPWTDIVNACIQYKLQSLSSNADQIICYREEFLAGFCQPPEWSSTLGWGAEKDVTTVHQAVEESVLEARERSFIERDKDLVNKELESSIKKEQKASLRYEKMLENALSDNYEPSKRQKLSVYEDKENDCDPENAEDMVEDVWEEEEELMYTREHVPVISYLSPSLGRLVSPRAVVTRQEVFHTGMSPRNSFRSSRVRSAPSQNDSHGTPPQRFGATPNFKRKPVDNLNNSRKRQTTKRMSHSPEPKLEIDEKMDFLKSKINADIEECDLFEKRLHAALL